MRFLLSKYADAYFQQKNEELKSSLMNKLNRNKDAVGAGVKGDQDKAKESLNHAER